MNQAASWNMGPQGYAEVNYGSDDKLNVFFHKKPTINKVKSAQEGRPVYEALDYIHIQQPGERDYTDRPVDEVPEVRIRFATKWNQYQNNQAQVPDGTPLAFLFPQNPEIAANLQTDAIGIHTIEQLANLTTEAQQRIGLGASDWMQKAKKFLEQSSKGVGHHKLEAELAKRDSVIEDMTQKMNMLLGEVAALRQQQTGVTAPAQTFTPEELTPFKPDAPRRGRPPKIHTES